MIPPIATIQLIAALLAPAPDSQPPHAPVTEYTFVVAGMNCPVCPLLARGALERLDGVRAVSSAPGRRRLTVRVRGDETDRTALLRALRGAGFRARTPVSPQDGLP